MTPPAGTANSTLPLNITRGNTPMTPPAGTANSTLPLNITRGNTPPSSDESPSPPSSETPPSPPSSSNSSNLVVGITVGTAVVLVFICGIIMLFRKRSPQRSKRSKVTVGPYYDAHPPNDHVVSIPLPHAPIPSGSTSHVASPLAFSSRNSKFTYEELQRATGGFSDANRLGEGGFGPVHKGTLRNGKEVAVKQLKAGSKQGEREFQAEVEIISRVHHRHLVSLVGYCRTGSQRLLAYEFVPNNTLEFHLHGKAPAIIDWSARQLIALGSAKGLAYLHEDCHPKIIHRDIKAANILLDFKFEAKVADFGLAKTASDLNTHVSTRAAGTFGYMDPEYFGSGQLTDKSDVYSYGVVLLELLTGRLPIDKSNPDMPVNLVEWARPFFKRASEGGNVDSMVDHRLKEFDHNEMIRMVACAEACTLQSGKDRPKMSQVVRVLEGAVSIADLNARVTREHRRS